MQTNEEILRLPSIMARQFDGARFYVADGLRLGPVVSTNVYEYRCQIVRESDYAVVTELIGQDTTLIRVTEAR